MGYYVFVFMLGLTSLYIMVHQLHLSRFAWFVFMLISCVALVLYKTISVNEFAKRDKDFDEVKTLAASFLGAKHIDNPWSYEVSTSELDTLIINTFKIEDSFKKYCNYKFERNLSPEIIALIMIIDAITFLINTGNYHDIDKGIDKLNSKGNYLYNTYDKACEKLELLDYFTDEDIDNYSDKIMDLIDEVGRRELSQRIR